MSGRTRLYLSYAFRSLRRGGQRSLLAIFCVAVGVMAVVALRLAGDMVTIAETPRSGWAVTSAGADTVTSEVTASPPVAQGASSLRLRSARQARRYAHAGAPRSGR